MFNVPTSTAPAALSRWIKTASCGCGCAFGVDSGAGERGQTGHVEEILDRIGYAGERPGIAARGARRIYFCRFSQRTLRRDRSKAIEPGIERLDARERRTDDFGGADLAAANRGGYRGQSCVGAGHGVKIAAGSIVSSSGSPATESAMPAIIWK